ncbi:BgTH12-03914 [Blumeria graminis f. sp. triticale]|uniref:BgTH12-03914 n=1 Tax=Blumeria graminis f. sp. triticale TaxID=1689686 RepID=A0A9W4GBT0_BLUGR|nr:BgTH12-03914 [Blumeria graminis f. sp. triticale]
MRLINLLIASATCTSAYRSAHEKVAPFLQRKIIPIAQDRSSRKITTKYLDEDTSKFLVNGSALPEFTFDIGESYAGSIPISTDINDSNQLWFWFFPSTNPLAEREVTIWLNGGPGCSSLNGLIQENGPFLWQSGTYQPILNPYSWTNLTNVIYIDQPVSTGFSSGNITVENENDVSTHFLAFWKNFVSKFKMEGYEVYITGEKSWCYLIKLTVTAQLCSTLTTRHTTMLKAYRSMILQSTITMF